MVPLLFLCERLYIIVLILLLALHDGVKLRHSIPTTADITISHDDLKNSEELATIWETFCNLSNSNHIHIGREIAIMHYVSSVIGLRLVNRKPQYSS